MSLLYPAVAIVTSFTAIASYVWYQRPVIAIRMLVRFGMYRAGLKIRYVDIKGKTFCYAERGTPCSNIASIIFIHGFTSSKDNWLTVIDKLPKDQHLVAVDLIGHGNSSLPTVDDKPPSSLYLTETLHELLTSTGLVKRPVHMIGTSMGGLVTAMYAGRYPNEIAFITLICPAVFTPIDTNFRQEVLAGRNSLLPKTVEDMDNLLHLVLYHKEKIMSNKQLLKGFVQLKAPSMDFYTKLFQSLANEKRTEDFTREVMAQVHKPTQIIWGENDELVHVSGAEFIRGLLSDCRRSDIFPECGHATTWDEPEKVTAAIVDFRREMKN